MAAKYNIAGFIYTDEATAKKAAKEEKAVAYLRPQIKWNNTNALLAAYNQLLDQKLFSTQVGLSFLGELREALLEKDDIDRSLVRPIDADTLIAQATSELPRDNTTPIRRSTSKAHTPMPKAPAKEHSDIALEKASDEAHIDTLKRAKSRHTKFASEEIELEESDLRKIRRLTAENKKYKLMSQIFGIATILLIAAVIGMFYIASTINSPTILNYEEEILNKYSSWEQSLTERERQLILKNQ